MKANKIKTVLLITLCILMAFQLVACGKESEEKLNEEVVFTFDGKDIALGEVYIYAKTVQQDYVATYGKDVWDMDVTRDDGTTDNMEIITREDIINNIIEVKILCKKAKDYDVELTENEKGIAENKATDFWKNLTDVQISDMQISENLVTNVLIENALADKVYKAIMAKANLEVSDEEARETTFYDMYFECYKEDGTGNISELSEDEKKTQYNKALQAYSTLIDPIDTENQPNVESLSEYYGLTNSSYYTMSPDDIKETYGQDVSDTIYSLEDGSYSLVTESQYGYHIFYMKALTDTEATNNNKQILLEEKEKAYFNSKYAEWLKKIDKKFNYHDSVSQSIYSKIVF